MEWELAWDQLVVWTQSSRGYSALIIYLLCWKLVRWDRMRKEPAVQLASCCGCPSLVLASVDSNTNANEESITIIHHYAFESEVPLTFYSSFHEYPRGVFPHDYCPSPISAIVTCMHQLLYPIKFSTDATRDGREAGDIEDLGNQDPSSISAMLCRL
jgi:hypothetical protein